ncbi:hypothetical protein KSC_044550 [Ktedonobacter sp. SOSP1-52]|uniref:type IV secretion system protein n=1 Tax=Ktedonobacter sp. SOSP1-52 TaxID=2778366 RepID=UPI001A324D83|nr:type IV secretion system protein [Ktedonobacter sp. SOSP1-52]GHO65563.1 hypothetical protein KSC_044550 [Ktedonobacter sp. SOSP1-52]
MSHLFTHTLLSLMTRRPYVMLTRWGGIVLLVMVGMLLTTHPPAPYGASPAVQGISLSAPPVTQAGGSEYARMPFSPSSQQQTFACGIGDVTCYSNEFLANLTEQIWNVVRPIIELFLQNPFNFLSQTPALATYDNSQIQQMVSWELGFLDTAVVVLIGFLAYNVLIGRSIGVPMPSLHEALPRLCVAFLAAHISLYICRLIIDFNNALCLGVDELFLHSFLKDTLSLMINFVGQTPDQVALGFLLRVWFVVFLFWHMLWLAWQMLVRLAVVALLTALSPLGLLCLALPQTQRWGQIWLSAFVSTVMIQFIQVTALSMGGLLVSYSTSIQISTGPVAGLDTIIQQMVALLLSGAMFYLVPRLPSMIQNYALRPILQAQQQADSAQSQVTTQVESMAIRAIAAL